jgi:hypothetical protein
VRNERAMQLYVDAKGNYYFPCVFMMSWKSIRVQYNCIWIQEVVLFSLCGYDELVRDERAIQLYLDAKGNYYFPCVFMMSWKATREQYNCIWMLRGTVSFPVCS